MLGDPFSIVFYGKIWKKESSDTYALLDCSSTDSAGGIYISPRYQKSPENVSIRFHINSSNSQEVYSHQDFQWADNKWARYIWVRDAHGENYLRQDSHQVNQSNAGTTPIMIRDRCYLGYSFSKVFSRLHGSVEDFRIYARALTPGEMDRVLGNYLICACDLRHVFYRVRSA